jgi:pseudouridine-5'-monophosphatase
METRSMARANITHVIYDVDGLLLDTERLYTQAYQIICGRYGKTFEWSLKSRTMGRKSEDSAKIITESLGLPLTPEQWLEERRAILVELFPAAKPMPGALRLTQHLLRHRVSQGIATSSARDYFDIKTSRHKKWFSIFDCIVSGDDPGIMQGKPAPDIFLLAAQKLQAEPACCLVFEDAPVGVEAARAAGMAVIAIPDPHMDRARYTNADEILASLAEFNPAGWGLPPYQNEKTGKTGTTPQLPIL